MNKMLLFFALTGTGIVGCSHLNMGMFMFRSNKTESDPQTLTRGQEAFALNCARCHGTNADGMGPESIGLGARPTNFRSPDFTKSATRIAAHTSYGKGSDMPPFVSLLPENTIWDIANYLESLQTSKR